MKKILLFAALILIVSLGSFAQDTEEENEAPRIFTPSLDDVRFGAYYDRSFGSTTFLLQIEAQRESGPQSALARVSYHWPKFEAQWFARIDFLEPAEMVGDVYVIEYGHNYRTVHFWNPDLVSPLLIEGGFEVFGDGTVFELLGYRLGDYAVRESRFPETQPENIPQPETIEERVLVGGSSVRIIEHDLEAGGDWQALGIFPKVRVLSYNILLPYQIQLLDEDGDLLHTIEYDWHDFVKTNIQGFNRPYAQKQVLTNHIVPGNVTELFIMDIEHTPLARSLFDINSLGQ